MTGIFDHLHIKRNTAGSSNELSFDVLDAARGDLDSKKKRTGSSGPIVVKPPKPVEGSSHGVKGAASFTKQEEVSRRKRERRAHSARIWVLALLVAVAVMCATVYVAYDYYQGIQQFRARMDDVVAGLVEVDSVQPSIEQFVADPYGMTEKARNDLDAGLGKALVLLDRVSEQSAKDGDFAVTEQDSAVLVLIQQTIGARRSMYDVIGRMISVVNDSATESSEINAIWNDVIAADQEARDAASTANDASSDKAIQNARDKTLSAKKQMEKALNAIEKAGESGSEIDLSLQRDYLALRISALGHAVATGDALLEGDKEKAAAENDAYNQLDSEAAALAGELPVSMEKSVKASFEENLASLKDEYEKARSVAIEADSLIRSYESRLL